MCRVRQFLVFGEHIIMGKPGCSNQDRATVQEPPIQTALTSLIGNIVIKAPNSCIHAILRKKKLKIYYDLTKCDVNHQKAVLHR